MPPSYLDDRLVPLLYDERAFARFLGIDLHGEARVFVELLHNRGLALEHASGLAGLDADRLLRLLG